MQNKLPPLNWDPVNMPVRCFDYASAKSSGS